MIILIVFLIGILMAFAAAYSLLGKEKSGKRMEQLEDDSSENSSTAKEGGGGRKHGRIAASFEDSLYFAGIKMDAGIFAFTWVVSVLLIPTLVGIMGAGTILCLILAVVLCISPFLIISYFKKRRTKAFEMQLADATDSLRGAMKAGYSFQKAVQTVIDSSDDPLKTEFETLLGELQLGTSMENALKNLSSRIDSRDVEIFCTALTVQSAVGGNIVAMLSSIAKTIRTRVQIRKEIRAKTGSGRLSGIIVGALPVLLFLFMYFFSPDYIRPFMESRIGTWVSIAGVMLMIAGFFIIRKVIHVEY